MSHAILSPSSAYRWLACPGSVRLLSEMPTEPTTSPAAIEGTIAHELAELALDTRQSAKDQQWSDTPDEMCEYVQEYVDYVRNLEGAQAYEQKINLNDIVPGSWGTADAVVYDEQLRHVDVVDLKYGMHKVYARENSQLRLYAAGVLKMLKKKGLKVKTITTHIHQPRAEHISTEELTAKELKAWAKSITPKAELCLTDDAPLSPSESACRFCDAAPVCPAMQEHALEVVGGDFEVLPDPAELTEEQVITVMDNAKLLNTWIGKVEAYAQDRMVNGHEIPGYKLVRKISRRRYTGDAEKALSQLLGDAAFKPQELITLSAAEKLVGKAKFEGLGITVKPEGDITVAPENDRRVAIKSIADDFSKNA